MAITGFAFVLAASLGIGCSEGPPAVESAVDSAPTTEAVVVGVSPVGFVTVTVILDAPGVDPLARRVWLAESPYQRQRGLTGVTDLGDAEGMLFVFDTEAQYQFYMWRTPIPLDIVFFDTSGDFVGSAEMDPCVRGTPASCERYSPDVAFLTAIELPAGSIEALRLGPGSSMTITDEPATTATTS